MAGGLAEGPGWGLSLPLAQVTFLCDMLLLYVDRKAHFYWKKKYEEVSVGLQLGLHGWVSPNPTSGFCASGTGSREGMLGP